MLMAWLSAQIVEPFPRVRKYRRKNRFQGMFVWFFICLWSTYLKLPNVHVDTDIRSSGRGPDWFWEESVCRCHCRLIISV